MLTAFFQYVFPVIIAILFLWYSVKSMWPEFKEMTISALDTQAKHSTNAIEKVISHSKEVLQTITNSNISIHAAYAGRMDLLDKKIDTVSGKIDIIATSLKKDSNVSNKVEIDASTNLS